MLTGPLSRWRYLAWVAALSLGLAVVGSFSAPGADGSMTTVTTLVLVCGAAVGINLAHRRLVDAGLHGALALGLIAAVVAIGWKIDATAALVVTAVFLLGLLAPPTGWLGARGPARGRQIDLRSEAPRAHFGTPAAFTAPTGSRDLD